MLDNIKLLLKEHNQEHLLKFYDELSREEQEHLLKQIEKIDFNLVKQLFNSISKTKDNHVITDIPSFNIKDEYTNIGLESFKAGSYAVVTMAGGQGTRLGFDGPKGTYILEYGINKSLFEIQCDKLKNVYKMSNKYTPWYIMTSYANDLATKEFFVKHNYFDYPKDMIEFFIQDELPMIDPLGKVLMDSKFNIKMGANGHGGIFKAMIDNNILDKMEKNNIKWIFIGGIDNILLPTDNPDLVGFSIKENFMAASKIIKKGYPDEKVGVFCKKDGKPGVIEYIEMTPEMNNLKHEDGSLVYGDAHILCNLFNISIIKDIAFKNLEYVGAFKKTDCIDLNGNLISSEVPNSYKFETFIFDAFAYVDEIGLLKDERQNVFAPIKNATGNDSPDTASTLYIDFYNLKNK